MVKLLRHNFKSYRMNLLKGISFGMLCLVILVTSGFYSFSQNKKKNDSQIFIKTELSSKNCYCGEALTLSVYLYSQTRNFQYVEPVSVPEVKNGKVCMILPVDVSSERIAKVTIGKNEYYKILLLRYVIVPEVEGKFEFSAPSFNAGVINQILKKDPFWGEYVTQNIENKVCAGSEVSFNVKKLPEYKGEQQFSGCVGDFTINAYLPPGNINRGTEATFVVEIEGNGMLPEDIKIDLKSAFGKSARLRSVSENRDRSYRDGTLYSEIEYVCEFYPEGEDEFELKSVDFVFFNPYTGKYQKNSTSLIKETYSEKKKSQAGGELIEI